MIEEYQKEETEAKEMALNVNIVSTKDKDKEKDKEKEEEERDRQEQQRNPERYLDNQKIQLCVALLQVSAPLGYSFPEMKKYGSVSSPFYSVFHLSFQTHVIPKNRVIVPLFIHTFIIHP